MTKAKLTDRIPGLKLLSLLEDLSAKLKFPQQSEIRNAERRRN